jgi:TPR repeat protein
MAEIFPWRQSVRVVECRQMKTTHVLMAVVLLAGAVSGRAAGIEEILTRANAGDPAAQIEAGDQYAKGSGVTRNAKEAVVWYTKAAEQGIAEAQMRLGALYLGGRGLPKDGLEAAKWFRLAADHGSAAAQVQMARMHLAGAGVAKDDVEAYKWASLATAAKDKQAPPIVSLLRQRMSGGQIARANQLIADFNAAKVLADPALEPGVPPVAPPLEE